MIKDLRIEEIEKGFALVNLPFELKDSFKKVFKTAKWDSLKKYWTVGVRSEKRLKEFVLQIQDELVLLYDLKEAEDEKNLNDITISKLRSELDVLKKQINDRKNELLKLNGVEEVIEKYKDNIIQLQEEKQKLDLILQQKKTESITIFNSIIDVEKIRESFRIMKYNFKKVCVENKREYYVAIYKMEEEANKLNEKGLSSPVLEKFRKFNWNRKDKFNPFDINIEDMYNLTEFKS